MTEEVGFWEGNITFWGSVRSANANLTKGDYF
jgi:hypothetical protein